MGEEIELAAKTTGETVAALAEASGVLGPSQEAWGAIASGIHYRLQPRVVKQAMAAAEKIKASGLPSHAYGALDDPLLSTILMGASLEEDESLQELWACLLANALTEGSARVTRRFPAILRDLEPVEAAALVALAGRVDQSVRPEEQELRARTVARAGIDSVGLDNLVGLGLLRYTREMPTTLGRIGDRGITASGVSFTSLGWAFVHACENPISSQESLGLVWAEPYEESEGS